MPVALIVSGATSITCALPHFSATGVGRFSGAIVTSMSGVTAGAASEGAGYISTLSEVR